MEERKSVSTNNQDFENCEKDFLFCDDTTENLNHATVKQYGRDILLQLRLHPMSLQKPRNLPGMEVIKEKLYLHDIADTAPNSTEKSVDASSHHFVLKPEHCSAKHDYRLMPHYFNNLYPYCYSPHTYNSSYQSASSKYRTPFHTYCNLLKKHCVSSHQCYKDFPVEECVWAKRCYPSSEDMWSCYSNHTHCNTTKKKEHIATVPKNKKKLPIIDPVTGKNVLEAVNATQREQSDIYPDTENSESSENNLSGITEEKYSGDFSSNPEINDETAHISSQVSDDSVASSSEGKIYCEKLKGSNMEDRDKFIYKTLDNTNEMMCSNISTVIEDSGQGENSANAKDETSLPNIEVPGVEENISELTNTEKLMSKLRKQEQKTSHNKDTNTHDIHATCQVHYKRECNLHICKESVSKQNDAMKESLRQVREKMYSLKQEEQKMAILQGFLRYKKYQLEESARNLDEQRIEIANWECNLVNKAKRLHDKEQWLESKNNALCNKAQQLAEKEKTLNEEESQICGDPHFSQNVIKESQFPGKKFAFDSCNNGTWDEIPKMRNYKNDESNDYSYSEYAPTTSNIPENVSSNVEKCKSDACSLDELERNIVFIEKMHSSDDVCDSVVGNKDEMASSNAPQKKDETASDDALRYSRGRRYLPEHIKYWLNKRDKSGL